MVEYLDPRRPLKNTDGFPDIPQESNRHAVFDQEGLFSCSVDFVQTRVYR